MYAKHIPDTMHRKGLLITFGRQEARFFTISMTRIIGGATSIFIIEEIKCLKLFLKTQLYMSLQNYEQL